MFKSTVNNSPIPNPIPSPIPAPAVATSSHSSASAAAMTDDVENPTPRSVAIRPLCEVPIANNAWGPWFHRVATSAAAAAAYDMVGECGVAELQGLEMVQALLLSAYRYAPSAAPHEPEGALFELATRNPVASFKHAHPREAGILKDNMSLKAQLKSNTTLRETLVSFSDSLTLISNTLMPKILRNVTAYAADNFDYKNMFEAVQNLPVGAVSLLGYSVKNRGENTVQCHSLVIFKKNTGFHVLDTNVGDECSLNQYLLSAEKLYENKPEDYSEFMKKLLSSRFNYGDLKVETMTLITYGENIRELIPFKAD